MHELSLGEKKRAALAGILVLHPKIILLDEPTAGLDYAGIKAMLGLLNELYAAGTTLIVSTHDSDLAFEWADEAWVMSDGRIAAQGPVEDVFRLSDVVRNAHLRVPALVELGIALQEADPPSPASRCCEPAKGLHRLSEISARRATMSEQNLKHDHEHPHTHSHEHRHGRTCIPMNTLTCMRTGTHRATPDTRTRMRRLRPSRSRRITIIPTTTS